ncbi:MAG TPA: M18 family aminopeptidase [Candidatus Cloacimonas sp.]|nr:M18 family aminopeptidase [Candidatus Cloacimonas sp.]HPS60722.1 M18 family aminopeptidase [Candidatus Cloacimonas sp.]
MDILIKDFLSFLSGSRSSFFASREIQKRLNEAGFICLPENKPFKLSSGGKYYLQRQGTAILAFITGSENFAKGGFNLAGSHIDYPCLKLKPQSIKTEKGITKIGVQVYGSPIISTWLDRELGIAGKVIVKTAKGYRVEYVDFQKPVAIIPNVALHLNREVNKGFAYNPQTQLNAILSVSSNGINPLYSAIAQELKVKEEQIAETELYLYDFIPAAQIGLQQEMIASQGLDNLAMAHAILSAILQCEKPQKTAAAIFFDNEEIGSQTPQGADSLFLEEMLERICLSQSNSREDFYLALRNSFFISADVANAWHPSFAEKYEPDYAPLINKGPVIKFDAYHRYASDAESSYRFIQLCEKANVPYQKFLVRSDATSGITIGPILASRLGLQTVDIGNPIWAMHSIRETGGTEDHKYLVKVLRRYFG